MNIDSLLAFGACLPAIASSYRACYTRYMHDQMAALAGDSVNTSIVIPRAMRDEIWRRARQQGVPMTAVVRWLIAAGLAQDTARPDDQAGRRTLSWDSGGRGIGGMTIPGAK